MNNHFCKSMTKTTALVLYLILSAASGSLCADFYQKVDIPVNPNAPLHKLKRQAIYDLRKSKIDEYKHLNIYPAQYVPGSSIFEPIDEGADWVNDTQFFIVNPYLLVLTSGGNYVNALLPYCKVDHVEYSGNKIEARYKGEFALQWFYYIYDYYPDSKGIVRLWFVNALDAGFKYAHVDPSRSMNIESEPNAPPDAVSKGVYSSHEFFHVGHLKKNNISPNDARAKLKLKNKNVKTIIYLKLWRNRPLNIDAKEDFAYVITIEP